MSIINLEKLESILLTKWNDFLDCRLLMDFAATQVHGKKVNKIQLSRFELTDHGFILWIAYSTNEQSFVTEALLTSNGIEAIETVIG